MRRWRYIKAAFLAGPELPLLGRMPLNAVAVMGLAILGFFQPGFWFLGAGLEAAWLSLLAGSRTFRLAVDRREACRALEQPGADPRQRLLDQLDPAARAQVGAVELRCRQIGELHARLRQDDPLLADNSAQLDQLRWLHLKLLTARHHLINHPLDDSRKDLERKLAALRQELDVARSDKEREAKAATLAMLGQRHGNLLQREATLAEIEADLGRLHAQLDLALDNVAMRRDERPHDLALNLATIHRLIDGDIFGDDRAAVAQLEARYGVRE